MRYRATSEGNIPFTIAEDVEFEQDIKNHPVMEETKVDLLINALVEKSIITKEDIKSKRQAGSETIKNG